jgi:hypothetical protein
MRSLLLLTLQLPYAKDHSGWPPAQKCPTGMESILVMKTSKSQVKDSGILPLYGKIGQR